MKKRIVALFIATVMVMAMTACKTKTEDTNTDNTIQQDSTTDNVADTAADTVGGMATIANPITQVESLEELNEMYKIVLCRPSVMGVTDEYCASIDCGEYKIAEYDFVLNGLKFSFRSSSVTSDISGVYTTDGTIFENVDGDAVICNESTKAARWFTIDGQYCLTVMDDGTIEEESFNLIVDELKARTLELYGGANTGDAE